MTNPFVFVVGCPRSGTTVLQRMLDAHPEVSIIPEVRWIPGKYEQRDGVTPQGTVTLELFDYLLSKRGLGRFTDWPVERDELLEFRDQVAAGKEVKYAELVTWLFDRHGKTQRKNLVGNKTPEYAAHLASLHELWPSARFVHLIRDGRDVCLSALHWSRLPKLSQAIESWNEAPVESAALWWEWHVRLAREAGMKIGPELYYEIRYESLVMRPREELSNLCRFLGLRFSERMVNFHEGRVRDHGGSDAKHAWRPVTPGLRDWRTQMSPEILKRFESIAGDLLAELGYARRLKSPESPAPEIVANLRSRYDDRPHPAAWLVAG